MPFLSKKLVLTAAVCREVSVLDAFAVVRGAALITRRVRAASIVRLGSRKLNRALLVEGT